LIDIAQRQEQAQESTETITRSAQEFAENTEAIMQARAVERADHDQWYAVRQHEPGAYIEETKNNNLQKLKDLYQKHIQTEAAATIGTGAPPSAGGPVSLPL